MTKIYISSPLKLDTINQSIQTELKKMLNIDVFLPISLDTFPSTKENTLLIAEMCYKAIDESNIIIVVIPFGLSVAAEIGYTVSQKRLGKRKVIIAFHSGLGTVKEEAMIDPYIDYQTRSIDELLELVEQLKRRKENSLLFDTI